MPGSFSQIYIQVVFAVSGRNSLIHHTWEERLYRYITGIVQQKEQKMLSINGMPNHIHFLIGMRPSCCLSDLVREVKKSSNDFIKKNNFTNFKFGWQEGYGAFSYSHSHPDYVINYIRNQKDHHKKETFKDEYIKFLNAANIAYEERFLFEWIDDNIAT